MESVELEGVAEDWVDTAVRVDTLAQVPVAARKPADLDADSGAAEGDCTWAVDNLADCIVAVARTLAEAELAGVGQECRPRLPGSHSSQLYMSLYVSDPSDRRRSKTHDDSRTRRFLL